MVDKDNIKELVQKYEEALEEGRNIYLDADEFNELAEYYDADDDIETARDIVEAGLKIHPDSGSLLLKKARFAIFEDQYTSALNIVSKLASYDLDLYLIRIECFLQLDLQAEAYELSKQVLDNEDSDLDNVLAELGFLYLDVDLYNEAILYFRKSLEYNSDNIEVLLDLAYAYEIQGDYSSAIEICNRILDVDSYHYETWVNIGKLYTMIDEYEKATDAFDFALTINDFDSNIMKLKAHCHTLSGRVNDAIEIFTEILSKFPEDDSIFFLISECYESLKEYDKAFSYLEKYAERKGDGLEVAMKKINLLLQQENEELALELALEYLAKNENSLELNLLIAEIQLRQGKFEEAEANLLKFYPINDDNFHLIDILAVTSIKKDNYPKAIEYTEKLYDLEPYNLNIKHRLALLYFESDNKELFNELLNQFTDKELSSLFKLIYDSEKENTLSRESLVFYLNEARECRTLFKNIKY